MIDAATFQSLRPHLFAVAYRMLSSAAEAEDVVQDAWLRAASAPADLASARGWLTTVVTRLCLDRLKAARTKREEYVGPWLPEPVPTGAIESAEEAVARRESVRHARPRTCPMTGRGCSSRSTANPPSSCGVGIASRACSCSRPTLIAFTRSTSSATPTSWRGWSRTA